MVKASVSSKGDDEETLIVGPHDETVHAFSEAGKSVGMVYQHIDEVALNNYHFYPLIIVLVI